MATRDHQAIVPGVATMLVVAALGRSALVAPDAIGLETRIRDIACGLAPVARNHRLVLFHSSGTLSSAVGMHAHLLGRELQNALPGMQVASLVGHCVVARSANAFNGRHAPCRLAEMDLLRRLLDHDQTIPCIGAIPVKLDAQGEMSAAATALDGDEAAATMATELGADVLLLLCDVDAIFRDWPDRQQPIQRVDAFDPEAVPAGMDRKLAAACSFARGRDTFAVIGRADRGADLLAGRAGTCVVNVR